jgi:hypothetical protein
MRVRVSLDFDILIESFISLCIIETVGAIFREYKPLVCLTLQCTVLWMVRGLVSQIQCRPKERANILDNFDHCVIKRKIQGLYSRKIAPTVSIIHKEIKDSIKIWFDLSQIITPIIDNRHLIVQNSSTITYFFYKYIQDQWEFE